jgi:hypothetical protein
MKLFKILNNKEIIIVDYPECISEYLHREISIMKYIDAKNLSIDNSIFIKPVLTKQFDGTIIKNGKSLNNKIKCRYNDLVYVSNIVNFISENRLLIIDRQVKYII